MKTKILSIALAAVAATIAADTAFARGIARVCHGGSDRAIVRAFVDGWATPYVDPVGSYGDSIDW